LKKAEAVKKKISTVLLYRSWEKCQSAVTPDYAGELLIGCLSLGNRGLSPISQKNYTATKINNTIAHSANTLLIAIINNLR
jgi:hypothetical protein